MTGAQAVFTILGVVAGVAGALGVAYAVFTSARVRQTIQLYQAENEAQGKRIATLEVEVEKLREQNAALRDLATGRSALEAFLSVFTRKMDDITTMVTTLLERSGGRS